MTVEAGSAKGAGVGPKVPVPTVNLPQLGLVARHYSVLVLLVGRPHTAGCDKPAWCAADRASPQCLQQHLPAYCCNRDTHKNTSQCPSSCIHSVHTQHTLLPSPIFHTIQLFYSLGFFHRGKIQLWLFKQHLSAYVCRTPQCVSVSVVFAI